MTDATAHTRAMVDPAGLAELLGVSRAFVYEHADELGGIRLGSGPRARLRFDVTEALERLTACSAGRTSSAVEPASPQDSRRRRPSRSGSGVDLLPIRGLSPAEKSTSAAREARAGRASLPPAPAGASAPGEEA